MACYRTKYQLDAFEESRHNWHKDADYLPQTLAEWFLHTQVASSGLEVLSCNHVLETTCDQCCFHGHGHRCDTQAHNREFKVTSNQRL